jgi:hypothetical protein
MIDIAPCASANAAERARAFEERQVRSGPARHDGSGLVPDL